MNFINTLPCGVAIQYSGGNQTKRFTELNPGDYLCERDLTIKPLKVKVWIPSTNCGGINVTETKWSGVIEGQSGKVLTARLNYHAYQLRGAIIQVFSVIITLRNDLLQLGLMHDGEPVEKAVSGRPLLR